MVKTATLLFPMDSLRVCAFTLPRTPQSQSTLQSAIKLAKNLEFLQIYVQTHNTSKLVLRLIEMLPDLPKVSSLRVVTDGCATCLPVMYLQHIAHLELGLGVYFDDLPSSLRSLAVQTLGTRYQGYAEMLAKLSHAVVPIRITVQACESADLSGLDPKLQGFSLQMPLVDISEHSNTWWSGLARLTKLRVLCVSDFLTETFVALLAPLCFPELHSLGFSVEPMGNFEYSSVDAATGDCTLTPSQHMPKLGVTFPALQQLKIFCYSLEDVALGIKGDGITSAFPGLCGVTYCSPVTRLKLHDIPSRVQIASKC